MFNCNCKATEIVLGLVLLVFSIWQFSFSRWVMLVVGILLILHALGCNSCRMPMSREMPARRRKRR